MENRTKLVTAERVCQIAETLGVFPTIKVLSNTKRKTFRAGLTNFYSLNILGRVQRVLAGHIPWEIPDEGYPHPDWYLNPIGAKVKSVTPLPDILKGLSTSGGIIPLFDKGSLSSEKNVIQEVNDICDILETPLHELMNIAVTHNNRVYQVLAQEFLQRDPTEDYTPKTINFRRILPYEEGAN